MSALTYVPQGCYYLRGSKYPSCSSDLKAVGVLFLKKKTSSCSRLKEVSEDCLPDGNTRIGLSTAFLLSTQAFIVVHYDLLIHHVSLSQFLS